MTDNTQDRIRIAEAINYERVNIRKEGLPPLWMWMRADGQLVGDFDPFTDANDDYAVLEFMRKDGMMPMSMYEKQQWHYTIGDYARAFLKVLDNG